MKHKLLLDMLTYKRPSGTTKPDGIFCSKFLKPVFGEPDRHGNFTYVLGNKPRVAFMSHWDTVHRTEGTQSVFVEDDIVSTDSGECLGADCTTGIYLQLMMISQGIEGVYVVHANEEVGCKGSQALVKDNPAWLDNVDIAISFDRFGYKSIITHQMGLRSASDEFAGTLSDALGLEYLSPDPTGSYTDSNEYVSVVSECTNLSVGYFDQHSPKETQDLHCLDYLLPALVSTDWDSVRSFRDPSEVEYEYEDNFEENKAIYDLVFKYPEAVADFLQSYNFTAYDLAEEIAQHDDSVLTFMQGN